MGVPGCISKDDIQQPVPFNKIPASKQLKEIPLTNGKGAESVTSPNIDSSDKESTVKSSNTPSPTGYCAPVRSNCVPCDPGLPGNSCIPNDQWPPTSTFSSKDTDSANPPSKSTPEGIDAKTASGAESFTSESNQEIDDNSIPNQIKQQDEENGEGNNATIN